YWLDLVRYADSVGYHSDNPRTVWRYRDYVIDAFNRNLPFDRFTAEQLAGDLLPGATLEQKIAPGYNRLLPTTEDGGAQPKGDAASPGPCPATGARPSGSRAPSCRAPPWSRRSPPVTTGSSRPPRREGPSRRSTGPSTSRTGCGARRRCGWPRPWAAPSATTI